ncbi:Coiled-coil domain-containing protein 83 [Geodia barretti]|uniref:Coiled-coil domain-containing protein 83 n=1 Tax=Geodia barretti TaxID=519541 RepID=A0AA35WA71_GEOBA|nr:Coiled-coil domain-containing protein 83 [Geodia barretti]
MGKKKGGKGKKEKSEDGLPPPPDLDSQKEGAREALLTFRIQGKEDSILTYEEEAENFKDRNYRQKEKNYDLRTVQTGYRKAMLQQALEYESQEAEKQEVTAEAVEEAMLERLQLARDMETALEDLEDTIVAVGQKLEVERRELDKWLEYKEEAVHTEETRTQEMKQQMKEMRDKEIQMEKQIGFRPHHLSYYLLAKWILCSASHTFSHSEQESRMGEARLEIEAKWQKRMEREKDRVSEKLLDSMDKEGRAEMVDNGWLKREIVAVGEMVTELKREVEYLEQRNLQLLEEMQREQLQQLEISIGLLRASTGHTRISSSHAVGDSGASPSLPSLVDVSKNTTTSSGTAGRLGQVERQTLHIRGGVAPLALPPDSTHLPPLAQQRSCHSALPPRGTWPVTADMLDSIT